MWRSGSCRIYPLAVSLPAYTGGAVGTALPLNAPPAPLSLGAARLLGILMKVLQQVSLLCCYRDEGCLINLFVVVDDMSNLLL